MNTNRTHQSLAFFLSIALLLPIVIKSEHMMFSKHHHQCNSCTHQTTDLSQKCEIQDFVYFNFTSVDNVHVPQICTIVLPSHKTRQTTAKQVLFSLDYGLRAPPSFIEL